MDTSAQTPFVPMHQVHAIKAEKSLEESDHCTGTPRTNCLLRAQTHALLALYWLKAGDPLPMMEP